MPSGKLLKKNYTIKRLPHCSLFFQTKREHLSWNFHRLDLWYISLKTGGLNWKYVTKIILMLYTSYKATLLIKRDFFFTISNDFHQIYFYENYTNECFFKINTKITLQGNKMYRVLATWYKCHLGMSSETDFFWCTSLWESKWGLCQNRLAPMIVLWWLVAMGSLDSRQIWPRWGYL